MIASQPDGVREFALTPDERWPFYSEDEISAVAAVLRSGRVNQWTGTTVSEFERAMSGPLGGFGIALANGSVALELALRTFGIGPGDEVIVTPRSFIASASCVSLLGATPVFAEVDHDSGNITAKTVEAVLTHRTRAVIPVHLAGWPVDMPAIMELAGQHGLWVLEDCAQAHGAEIDGRPVGSFGHASAFSFCQDKIISTGGEGGFASFKNPEEYERAWSFKDHGKNRSKVTSPHERPGYRWLHDSIGTNWRLTGPQAQLGLSQLRKLEGWRAARALNAAIWRQALERVGGVRVPVPQPRFQHAFYKLYAYIDAGDDGEKLRDAILREAGRIGLKVYSGSCSELYREQAFRSLTVPNLPVARQLGRTSLMFEVHPTLDPERTERRAQAFADIAKRVLCC